MSEPLTSSPTEPSQAPLDIGVLDLPPAKTRRRGPNRLTRTLLVVLAMVLAFSCGTRVGKRAAKPAAPPPPASANGQPPAGVAVTGRVKVVDGSSFYVADDKGQTVKVLTDASTRLATTRPGTMADLRPGDTVEVRGKRNPDGTVSATSLTDTPAETAAP